jgi:hypothetical protein
LSIFPLLLLGLAVGCTAYHNRELDLYQPPLAAGAVPPVAWLEVTAPLDNAVLRQIVELVEVSGRAGFREVVDHDVVLAIDFSTSTFLPTGRDIDADGTVGEYREWVPRVRHKYRPLRRWTTDFGDTIVQAELRAAEVLIAFLGSETSRVGIVTFWGEPRLSSPVGHPDSALAALDELRIPKVGGETDLGDAIELALRALHEASQQVATRRRQSIVLLSDGLPTAPSPVTRAKLKALQCADRAKRAGVRIHAFAFGPRATRSTFFEQVASRTGGRFFWIENPGALADYIPYVLPYRMVPGLETVAIKNLSAQSSASAVRVFADGSFDGFLQLVSGENRVEVVATVTGGEELRAARTVFYEKPEAPTAADRRATAKLRDRLRERTIETELAVEALGRGRAHRELIIEVEQH